jgi:hypothetical protein
MIKASRSKDSSIILQQRISLILSFSVNVKLLFAEGIEFAWDKPGDCPKCGGCRLWGHGFVTRYFEGVDTTYLWVKRWRCPDCKAVHTARPKQFFGRFRYAITTILACLYEKIVRGKWMNCIPFQVQQYWYAGLRLQASRHTNAAVPELSDLRRLLAIPIVPVTHSTA